MTLVDPAVRAILVITVILATFTLAIFLANLLIGIMTNTLSDVAANARSEFASHLVRRRWLLDQAAFELPSPLNLVHFVLLCFVDVLRLCGVPVYRVPAPASEPGAAARRRRASTAGAAAGAGSESGARSGSGAAGAGAAEGSDSPTALLGPSALRAGPSDREAGVELARLGTGSTAITTTTTDDTARSSAPASAARVRGRRRVVCAYCHHAWTNTPFSITRPASNIDKRFPAAVLYEMNQNEAGRRLCRYCLRAQRVLTERQYASERLAMHLLLVLVFPIALLGWVLVAWPAGKLVRAWRGRRTKAEDQDEEDVRFQRCHYAFSI